MGTRKPKKSTELQFDGAYPIKKIKPYDNNPRKNDHAVKQLSQSIEEFGFIAPIIIDCAGRVCAGNTRLKAAISLGRTTVPVIIAPELTGNKFIGYNIADNKIAELADWDDPALVDLIRELEEDSTFDIDTLGFQEGDLDKLFHDVDRKRKIKATDRIPPLPKKAKTKLGDVYELGKHRLVCGDACDPDVIDSLMGNKKANMIFTDPPWNVNIGKNTHPKFRQGIKLKNDNLTSDQYEQFLNDIFSPILEYLKGDLYCVLGPSEWPKLDLCLRRLNLHWSSTIIWLKQVFVLGRSKYHSKYEPIWYGWPKKGRSSFQGKRNLDDVWEYDRPMVSKDHPTMKPVPLVANAIQNSSKHGQIVVDQCLGSGTTLIACEESGRVCYGVEIAPIYCDVIVKRWETFSGKKAKRIRKK